MADGKPGAIRVGIGGWTYAPWRGTFYPADLAQKRELEHASRRLTTIEVNGTYYGSQKPATFAKWRDETPQDFVFALKAPRFATNRRALAEAGGSVERFFTSGVMELGGKLGPINWQFMATKKFDPQDFAEFLELLPPEVDGRRVRHAVEVRHESFQAPEFADLARERGVAIIHSADGGHPLIDERTADFIYARIMGTSEDEKAGYSQSALDGWAARARDWAADGRDVFLYVIGGFKERNPAAAMELIERLG